MDHSLKTVIKAILPEKTRLAIEKHFAKREIKKWKKAGEPVPPPHAVKQKVVSRYRRRSGFSILIETGTYMGAMVEAQKSRFDRVISIELSPKYYEKARKRFRKDMNVQIVEGDSGMVLPAILAKIDEPVIFWLDGHYSHGETARGAKECPIFEELDAILKDPRYEHIILIDDARCFNGRGDYPTIDNLTRYIQEKNPRYRVRVKHDIIRYTI